MPERWLPLIAFALSLATAPAMGQAPDTEVPTPPPSAAPSLAAPIAPLPGEAAPLAGQLMARPSWIDAQESLAQAHALFDAGNYDAALQHFNRAYALLDGHPRRFAVLNNIAVCHERLFQYDEAVEYYERYLHEAPVEVGDRQEVQRIVTTLSALLARVEVHSDVEAHLWVDGRRMEDAPGEYRLPAGRRVFELSAIGHEDIRLEITLQAGERRVLPVVLPATETYRGLSPTPFYAATALTGALLLGSGTLGVAFLVEREDARQAATAQMNYPTSAGREDQSRVDRLALAADLTLLGALIGGATSVILFLLTDFEGEAEGSAVELGFDAGAAQFRSPL